MKDRPASLPLGKAIPNTKIASGHGNHFRSIVSHGLQNRLMRSIANDDVGICYQRCRIGTIQIDIEDIFACIVGNILCRIARNRARKSINSGTQIRHIARNWSERAGDSIYNSNSGKGRIDSYRHACGTFLSKLGCPSGKSTQSSF